MKTESTENSWDKLLRIKTMGRDDSHADQYNYPYEPTPYCVLERLANSGYIQKNNTVLDYGCGKGRVDFFLSYQLRCQSIGIEYDERIYAKALENQAAAVSGKRTVFLQAKAETFEIPQEADRFYFFNPFSPEILRSVIGRILDARYRNPQEMLLFFYYPSDEYLSLLMSTDELMFLDEIDCQELFPGRNSRERILIFEIA